MSDEHENPEVDIEQGNGDFNEGFDEASGRAPEVDTGTETIKKTDPAPDADGLEPEAKPDEEKPEGGDAQPTKSAKEIAEERATALEGKDKTPAQPKNDPASKETASEEEPDPLKEVEDNSDPEHELKNLGQIYDGLDPEKKTRIQSLFSEIPEIAEVFDVLIGMIGKRAEQPKAQPQPTHDPEAQKFWENVEKENPDVRKTIKSPEFGTWFNKQSAAMQRLANSNDPADALALLNAYAEDSAKETSAKAAAEKVKTEQTAKRGKEAAIHAKAVASTGKSDPASPSNEDFDGAFNEATAETGK